MKFFVVTVRFAIGICLALLAYREWGAVAGVITFLFGGYVSDTHYRVMEMDKHVRNRQS